ncbi:hypothetical protein L1049_014805 [Liquidambar formosana]|uniref:F-box domain-containing protein n=1 Tax=Liquidambar formosana TaxID=63359 RepID=A0AAP0RXS6_LIQFO
MERGLSETMNNSGKRILHSADHSAAAEAIGGNGDLVRGILLRLPIKSLLRFESVSKKWLSLISDPHFSQSYTRLRNINPKPSGLLLNHGYAIFQFIHFNDDGDGNESWDYLSYPDISGRYTILQSCNGLLLCSFAYWRGNSVLEYLIINPTTKQFFHFPTRQYKNPFVAINLAFDPLKSPHYKLVCVGRAKKPV